MDLIKIYFPLLSYPRLQYLGLWGCLMRTDGGNFINNLQGYERTQRD
jgi:hypothetical protein